MPTTSTSTKSPIKVLIVHNFYRQRGGEDAVVEAEMNLLRRHGHDVFLYSRSNDEVQDVSRLSLAAQTLWSIRTYQDMKSLLREHSPDIVHVHNTLPLVSPSVYWAAAAAKATVVQTLHNFRLLCPQALMLRDQRVCEDCLGRMPWRAIRYRCYRDSAAQSAVVGGTLQLHRWLGTWDRFVHRYIVLSDFCRVKFIEGGLPERRLVVKPNFVDFVPVLRELPRGGLLFVGRMAPEKGIHVLATALEKSRSQFVFDAIGSGPLAHRLAALSCVRMHGDVPNHSVREAMAKAVALVVPSIWNEPFGVVIIEAFASGLPVIASRIGSPASMVEHGVTGLLVEPGDSEDLAAKMSWALSNPDEMGRMGRNARLQFESMYTSDANYRALIDIYHGAMAELHHCFL